MVDGDREDPPENDGPLASTSSRRSAGNVYKQLLADLEEREMGGGLNLNEHIEAVGWGKFQRTALVAFVLFVVSEAMEVTVPNVLWQKVSDSPAFSPGLDGHTTTFRAIVTGAPMLGNVFGGILGGVIADAHGRHPAIYLHCALFVLSSLVSALSQTRTSFLLSRMALGASLGIIVPVIVSYMAELAPSKYRARAVVIIPGFGFPLGQVLMLMCGLLLHHYSDDADTRSAAETTDSDSFGWWRVMLVAGIIPNVAAMLLVRFCVPESPHFLVGSGRQKEAEEVLREIARVNRTEHRLQCHGRILRAPGKRSDAHADSDEVSVDGGPGTHTGDKDNSWAGRVERLKKQGIELLSPPLHVYVVMILGMWMFAVIGQTGADVMLPKLLETTLDLDMQGRLTAQLYITIFAWPAFFFVILFLESDTSLSLSRRTAACAIAVASCCACVLAALLLHYGLLLTMCACVLVKMLSHGLMQAMDLYAAELLPSTHRATGLSLANGSSKVMGILVSFIALTNFGAGEDFGASLHLLLFGAAFAATACVAFLSPDMGKSRNLVLNYDELCTAHEERTSGTKDRGAPEAAKEPLGSSEVRSYETFGDVEKQR